MGKLDDKVAIIVGGSTGIGASTVELFAEEGAKVIIAGLQPAKGAALAEKVGRDARYLFVDVTDEAQLKAVITETATEFGKLDCLINYAGVPGRWSGVAEVELDEFNQGIAINLTGTLLGIKHASSVMMQQGSGSIVNIGSLCGQLGGWGGYPYSAAKAAVLHLTRCAAMELGQAGVRVNAISPGPIVTPIFAKGVGVSSEDAEQALDGVRAAVGSFIANLQSIPRAGAPKDVAQVALFLASDDSAFMNGQILTVDGGISAGRPASVTQADWTEMARAVQESLGTS